MNNQYFLKSPTMSYLPEYMSGAGCGHNDYGMVTQGNVATFGAMELGRSTYSYDRAIARTRAKIKLLKRRKARVKFKPRKAILQARIDRLNSKLKKLIAYKRIRIQKQLDKSDAPVAEDEDFLLNEAFEVEPLIPEIELQQQEQIEIQQGIGGFDLQRIALFGGIGIGALLLARMLFGKKKAPRKNRMKMGRKSNPKRRKSKRRVKRRRK